MNGLASVRVGRRRTEAGFPEHAQRYYEQELDRQKEIEHRQSGSQSTTALDAMIMTAAPDGLEIMKHNQNCA